MPDVNKIIGNSKFSFPVQCEKITEYANDTGKFMRVKIFLMHLGKNLNGSIFEKETVDKAIPSLAYIPIVGLISKNSLNEKDFKGHEYIISKNENGIHRKYIGHAYGVVLSQDENNAHYEDRICDDGETRTFLVVEGILWGMFEDCIEIMNRDVIKSNSMELVQEIEGAFDGYENEDGDFVFTDFSFRAACILGQEKEPAMTGSTIEVQFTVSDFVKNIQSELNNKYVEFTQMMEFSKSHKDKQKGGNVEMKPDFSQTVMQQFDDIARIVADHEMIKDRWNDLVSRFYLVDIQDNEVIIVDRQNGYQYYGCEFALDGDKPVINFDTAKRKKITYADYVEGEPVSSQAFDFGKHISELEDVAFAKVTEAEEKVTEAENKATTAEEDKTEIETNYESLKKDYEEIKPKYDNYVKEEQERIEKETDEKKDKMFAQFEASLKDEDEFNNLKENKSDFTVDEIESKCSIMFARKNISTNFSKTNKSSGTLEVLDIDDGEPNFVPTKYGNIRTGNK